MSACGVKLTSGGETCAPWLVTVPSEQFRPSMDECCELFVLYLWRKHEKLDLQRRRGVGKWTGRKRGGRQQLYV